MTEIKQTFEVNGKHFATKAEAVAYAQVPVIREALNKLTSNNTDLTEWLITNKIAVQNLFKSAAPRRVTKAEHKQLAKALNYIASKLSDDPQAEFVISNIDNIQTSFKYPTVKRMSDEEQTVVMRDNATQLADGNKDLALWLIDNKAAVLTAYDAGKPKREVSQKAMDALAAYRAKKAAEKEAAAKA